MLELLYLVSPLVTILTLSVVIVVSIELTIVIR